MSSRPERPMRGAKARASIKPRAIHVDTSIAQTSRGAYAFAIRRQVHEAGWIDEAAG